MTTERAPRGAGPAEGRAPLSPLEWRLGATAALAIVYLVAWSGVSATDDGEDAAAPGTSAIGAPRPGGAVTIAPSGPVWFDRLPVSDRPTLTLPEGYRLASSATQPSGSSLVARAERPARRRAIRVRTRSS